MKTLVKSRMSMLVVTLAATTALFAQTGGSPQGKPQSHASILDARQIVTLSVTATERSWEARDYRYTFLERDEDRRLDSRGQVKSEDIDITKMLLVNGARFEQLVEHNGQPPSSEQDKKRAADLARLQHETVEERTSRLRKDQENWSFLRDLLEAFDFQIAGEEVVDGRPAYVLKAAPHPGYHAHGKYGKAFANVEGTLWIDKQDFGWVKVDGQVTQTFSLGLIIARIQRGTSIMIEQTSVGDSVWVPKRIEVRANAKILFLKSLEIYRTLTYSDYRTQAEGQYSVSR